jgi:hypothetical protein
MTGKHLSRYPLFRLLSPRQLDDWLAAGQEIDCLSGFVLFPEETGGGAGHSGQKWRRRERSVGIPSPRRGRARTGTA